MFGVVLLLVQLPWMVLKQSYDAPCRLWFPRLEACSIRHGEEVGCGSGCG